MHSWFIRQAAPGIDVVRAAYEAVGKRYIGPVDALLPDTDEEEISLAISYLVRAGALQRDEDVAWEGRVTVPGDARRVLVDLARTDPELAQAGSWLLDRIERIGQQAYQAPSWSRQLSIEPQELEARLLALSRHDVVGFVSWRSAVQLRRGATPPDWQALSAAMGRRRRRVEDLSNNAKAYRALDGQCRRSWLLWYLDAKADGACDGCDVCVPDLPSAWREVEVSHEDLTAALPVTVAVLDLALRLEPFRFGRGTLEVVLVGEELSHNPHLSDEPSYGALRLLKRAGVAARIDALIDDGLLEQVEVDRDDRSYVAVRPTQAGRDLLVT